MLREFTKSVGRFQAGDVRDYPKATWDEVARAAGTKLEHISKAAGEVSTPISNREAARNAVKTARRVS